MKLFLTSLLAFAFLNILQAQEEFEVHWKSLDTAYRPGYIVDRTDTVFNANKAFMSFAIEHCLPNPADKKYISNRNLLYQLRNNDCDSSSSLVWDTLKNGDVYQIYISSRSYIAKEHVSKKHEEYDYYVDIDGQVPYGGFHGIPTTEIDTLYISINGKYLNIPRSAYSNFYGPNICHEIPRIRLIRTIEAYVSLDSQYLYVYLNGGNAANTYFSKLVFDTNGFITKIATSYVALSTYGSFGPDFLGY